MRLTLTTIVTLPTPFSIPNMQQYEQTEYELEEDELALGGNDELEQGEDTETEGGSDTETENDNWQQLHKGDEEEIGNDGSIRLDEGDVGQQPLHSQQPSILVWAKLPVNPGPSAPPADIDRWISILEFPIPDLTQLRLSKKPYKWIRFATGIVIGAKGDLRKTDDRHGIRLGRLRNGNPPCRDDTCVLPYL